MLEPAATFFSSFASCVPWFQRVKSIKHTIELILSNERRLTYTEEGKELLKWIEHQWNNISIIYLIIDHLLHDNSEMDDKFRQIFVENSVILWNKLKKTESCDTVETFNIVIRVLKMCNNRAANLEPAANCKKVIAKSSAIFVAFVSHYCVGDNLSLPETIIDPLINFVFGKPSDPKSKGTKRDSKNALLPLEQCLETSTTVKCTVLKILLWYRSKDMEAHMEKYISTMGNDGKSDQSYHNSFCFMVVRCIEDFINLSFGDSDIHTVEKYLISTDLSPLSSDGVISFKNLQIMAKLRFTISSMAAVIGEELQRDQNIESDLCIQQSIVNKSHVDLMRTLIANANTPWIQIFLVRNLYAMHGFGILKTIFKRESWHWILLNDINMPEIMDQSFNDNLLIYGSTYKDMVFKVLGSQDEHQSYWDPVFKEIQAGDAEKLVCLTLAAAKEGFNKKLSSGGATLLKAIITRQNTYSALQSIAPVCSALTENTLTNSLSDLGNTEDPGLLEVIIHAVLVITSSKHPALELLKSICLKPSTIKDAYIPTMPDDPHSSLQKHGLDPERVYECSFCNTKWYIDNCGKPYVERKCKCGKSIGGTRDHKPVAGFKKSETSDKTERGYLLGDPETRNREEFVRKLNTSDLCICRVLLHASMLWGSLTDKESICNIMKMQVDNMPTFFYRHLKKDIEFLARFMDSNTDDAILKIHLFLKYISNYSTELNCDFKHVHEKEQRQAWEECLETIIESFSKDSTNNLDLAKEQVAETAPKALLKIIYDKSSCDGLPTTGLLNTPCMWRFKKRMTVEHLQHLLHQEDGQNNLTLLQELLNKNICYLKHLPEILNMHQHLISYFQNGDILEWKKKSIDHFLKNNKSDEQQLSFPEVFKIIQTIWSNLRTEETYISKDILCQEIDVNADILDILPTKSSIIYLVSKFLIKLQNRLIALASFTNEVYKFISAEEVKSSSVIQCVPEKDLIAMALLNIQHVLEEDGSESTYYNFPRLQRQMVNRFISGKPAITPESIPYFSLNEVTMQSTIKKIKDQLKIQDPLSISAVKRIMEEVTSVSDLSSVLTTLKVAAEFLAVTGGDPERHIIKYIGKELRMHSKVMHFKNLPVIPQTQLKHISSLWQILLARRSILLVEMNQNPFFLIDVNYQRELSDSEKEELTNALSPSIIDDFILELHEMITVGMASCQPNYELFDCFELFLEDKKAITNLCTPINPVLKMEKIISVWKMAVHFRKSLIAQH